MASVLPIAFNSCMWGVPKKNSPAVTKDTLVYTYQTIKNRASDCGDKPDSECSLVKIRYPVFKGAKLLNDTVTAKLVNLFGISKTDTTLQMMSVGFLKDYDGGKKDNKFNRAISYNLDSYADVLRQDSSLTTLQVGGYQYTAGAHGVTFIYFINWDTKANKYLVLSDIFNTGYEDELTKIGETIFRKNENLSDTTSLKKNYFFKNAKFSLNHNFSITPVGIKFLYNIYEIKPYFAGQTDLLIPYAQIKSLLKPNTVITQYIK